MDAILVLRRSLRTSATDPNRTLRGISSHLGLVTCFADYIEDQGDFCHLINQEMKVYRFYYVATALLRVAHAARDMLRVVDCVARLGGDEFVLLLPNTGLHGAAAVGAKLQHAVRHADQARASSPVLTLSVGVTLFSPGEDIKCAMARADEALYAAKAAGRDRVEVKCHEPPLSLVPRCA